MLLESICFIHLWRQQPYQSNNSECPQKSNVISTMAVQYLSMHNSRTCCGCNMKKTHLFCFIGGPIWSHLSYIFDPVLMVSGDHSAVVFWQQCISLAEHKQVWLSAECAVYMQVSSDGGDGMLFPLLAKERENSYGMTIALVGTSKAFWEQKETNWTPFTSNSKQMLFRTI